ncbi:MAG TPA: POTRA domain-containing protein [Bacteroidales bacterium]|jgi:outer membrane protein assembly factor BamA|nr:MAG: Outer membrane protein assembly factor BamA [Bacteroidetes bacterium ADurb.Bin012]HNQ60354.1 POTRA domain-containing protein [Bacteroidales bacterium]HNU20994.1 POTRA domain-containing protein [Bacteroidales bacterium]HNV17610.1 POTRA domain-containing protein [Bacteroidales bacterium]HOC16096.1 POTRA domain-containing protein [Bacteroidales bacterium]
MKRIVLFIACLSLSGYCIHAQSVTHKWIVDTILIEGNHITKASVIKREIVVKPGDSVAETHIPLILERSRDNLRNISLFNFVDIDTMNLGINHFALKVSVVERWYVWPYPIFEIADRNFNTWWRARNFDRLNYGIKILWDNFRGSNQTLSICTRLGYDHKITFEYIVPFIDKKRRLGLSFGFSTGGIHEAAALTNLNNEVDFIKTDERYIKTDHQAFVAFTYRRNFNISHRLEASYNHYHAEDTLVKFNPMYGPCNVSYLSVSYLFKADYRDYKHYPLKGWYMDLEVDKYGLGILDDGNIDLWKFSANYRIFSPISNKLYLAFGLYSSFQPDILPPYPLNAGLGYGRYFVRGYEYYVIEGYWQSLAKTTLKYTLIPQKITRLHGIKSEKFSKLHYAFYLNLFSDLGYSKPWSELTPTRLNNQLLYSIGIGLDFVTYYDKVLRLECTLNHKGETGIYLHFMAAI